MQIAHITNPFYKFLKSCNETWIDLDNIPRTSKDHIFGTCEFFNSYWVDESDLDKTAPNTFYYKFRWYCPTELYKIWEKNHPTNKSLYQCN